MRPVMVIWAGSKGGWVGEISLSIILFASTNMNLEYSGRELKKVIMNKTFGMLLANQRTVRKARTATDKYVVRRTVQFIDFI